MKNHPRLVWAIVIGNSLALSLWLVTLVCGAKTVDPTLPGTSPAWSMGWQTALEDNPATSNATEGNLAVYGGYGKFTTNYVNFGGGDGFFSGNLEVDGGINGNAQLRTFAQAFGDDDVSASQSAAEWGVTPGLDVGGDQKRIVVVRDSYVYGISCWSNAASTSGTLSVAPTMDGTASTTFTCGLNTHSGSTVTSNTVNTTGFFVAAGHAVGVKATTSSTWTPTTADVDVVLFISEAPFRN